jgi:hypothetical protein
MKAVLIYLSGEQSLHDLTDSAVYSGGIYQGRLSDIESHEESHSNPPIVVVDVGHKRGARCIFMLRADESYREEAGNHLPIYRELPWVMAG